MKIWQQTFSKYPVKCKCKSPKYQGSRYREPENVIIHMNFHGMYVRYTTALIRWDLNIDQRTDALKAIIAITSEWNSAKNTDQAPKSCLSHYN